MKLQPWMLTISYLPGAENTVADALSRQEWGRGESPSGVGRPRVPETVSLKEKSQSGVGECEGPALTEKKREEG